MSRNESIQTLYPLLGAFGRHHAFLSPEESAVATAEERIRSIWPYLVRRVLEFRKTLRPSQRVNFDAEDVAAELWVALAERDSRWMPERGLYIAFAATIVNHELLSIRDRAYTIHSPRNSSCRLKEYASEEAAGTIKPERRQTASDILRTQAPADCIAESDGFTSREPNPLEALIGRESAERRDAKLRSELARLPAEEADAVVRVSGLFGAEAQTEREVAESTGRRPHEVRRLRSSALAILCGQPIPLADVPRKAPGKPVALFPSSRQ